MATSAHAQQRKEAGHQNHAIKRGFFFSLFRTVHLAPLLFKQNNN
jgi:hypothetical protein